MSRWADMMRRLGGVQVTQVTFDDEFFQWWEEEVITIEDNPYAMLEFKGDL